MPLTSIILAAGKSTRMKSRLPKPLHDVCGVPMLGWILQACFDAGSDRVIVVVGHGKDEVIARFGSDKRIIWVEQTEQLGTGHAVRMCEPELRKAHGDVFILAGDGPLIRAEVLRNIRNAHRDEHAAGTLATAVLDDATGYGRIARDDAGNFVAIVEHSDATPEQLKISEVFPSYYCVKSDDLLAALPKLTNHNAKREYYLTDIYAILKEAGKKVLAVQAVTAEDTLSVNTRQQLADVDALMQARIQREHRAAGVTIVQGSSVYVEAAATIGMDTTIHPFSFIGSRTAIGSSCVIGPFANVPRESIVPDGASVKGS